MPTRPALATLLLAGPAALASAQDPTSPPEEPEGGASRIWQSNNTGSDRQIVFAASPIQLFLAEAYMATTLDRGTTASRVMTMQPRGVPALLRGLRPGRRHEDRLRRARPPPAPDLGALIR